jgi:hypothetical protein
VRESDYLYQKHAARMEAAISLAALDECAEAIFELLKSVRPVSPAGD